MKSSRRFHVSTYGLSPDLKRVHPAFGSINRGDIGRKPLSALLELFRQLDTDAGPALLRIVIEADNARYTVSLAGKQLRLAVDDQVPGQGALLTTPEIIARLEYSAPISVAPPPRPVEPMSRSVTTLVLLFAGVALMAQAVLPRAAPTIDSSPTDVVAVNDPAEVKTRQQAVTGIYATGDQAGDRLLTVSADGHIVFAELGARQSLGNSADSYHLGRRGQQTCLVTPRSGIIEARDANTLVYYGDTYRRIN
jgi:hypothetical protein